MQWKRLRTLTLQGLLFTSACTGGDDTAEGFGEKTPEPEDPTSGNDDDGSGTDGTTGGSGGDGSDGGDAGGGPKFDVSAGQDIQIPPPEGGAERCTKVDFLFVIDNSGSMEDEQQNLATSFPEFIFAIQNIVQVDDFHIMAIDSDAAGSGCGHSCINGNCSCMGNTGCCCKRVCAEGIGTTCDGQDCSQWGADGCDAELGAGIVTAPDGTDCGVSPGTRYMVPGQADLENAFSCIATVGIEGSGDEKPMEAMVTAVSPDMIGPGGCNEGFVRDDALLVVVDITDEEDDHEGPGTACMSAQPGSAGEPPDWYDALAASKYGVEKNIVVLSLIGTVAPDPECPPLDKCGGGTMGAEPAPRIVDFTTRFTYGTMGQVCAPTYELFFQDAISVIDVACENFDPPG